MEATSVVLTKNGLVRIDPPSPDFCARGLGGAGHQKALDIAVRSRSPHPRAGTPIEGDELLEVNGGFLSIIGREVARSGHLHNWYGSENDRLQKTHRCSLDRGLEHQWLIEPSRSIGVNVPRTSSRAAMSSTAGWATRRPRRSRRASQTASVTAVAGSAEVGNGRRRSGQ
jgi:hypothetical protein